MVKKILISFCLSAVALVATAQNEPYRNPDLSPSERAWDLLKRMTLEEKISQMKNGSPAIERLGIPAYNWWNEALHGVARAGKATVFPQAIGLAATFDNQAVHETFSIVSDEARAKYHDFQRKGERDGYKGLTFWTPNINIYRDPRWGARFADRSDGCERLAAEMERLAEAVRENRFTPTMLSREGKPVDFTYCSITQYGAETVQTTFPSFSALLDAFYTERDRQEAAQRRGRELTRTVTSAHDRVVRKLGMLEKEYAASQDRDTLRLYGDLITANLYRMERGAARLTAQNYYDENGAELDIPLDPLLTPQQNAAKYYKRYTKAKTAEKHLREQIDKAIGERDYLESVQGEIALAQTEAEFAELRRELQETGYLRRSGKEKKGREKPIAPREFRSSSGLRILVGRSNVQNDALTRKADKRDLWLHTQKIHGSHVILCTEDGAYDDESLHEAALLAAYYSQAQGGSNVPVDYTSVKYVKKPAGTRPGMVVYETYRTLYVTPDEETIRRLDRKNK